MTDEIIAEVWRNRDRLAERYGYDLDAIVAAMRERERGPLNAVARRQRPGTQAQPTADRRD